MLLLSQLPTDVLLSLLRYLSIEEVLKLRRTSRGFQQLTRLRSVWHLLLRTQILQKNIPIPRLSHHSIDALNSRELERVVIRTFRLRLNWELGSAAPTNEINITTSIAHIHHSRVIALRFLVIRRHHYLISISSSGPVAQGVRTIECWNIESRPPVCVARRQITVTNKLAYAFNTDPSSRAILAVKTVGIEILSIDFSVPPYAAFITLSTIPIQVSRIYAFSGSTIISRGPDPIRDPVRIWNINHPAMQVVLRSPQPSQQENCHEAIIEHDFAILLEASSIALYPLTYFREGRFNHPLSPVVRHAFHWQIDSARIVRQASYSAARSGMPGPINILIRFSSGYPWPVNMLHHYSLEPDASYDPSSYIDMNNLPYHFPPTLRQSIAAPVRLFGVSDMAIGAYGTAVWFDTQVEDYYAQVAHGQRLAGRVLALGEDEDDYISDQVASNVASMVLRVDEEDRWVSLELDEGEGRIAIGKNDGCILLLDYA